MNLPFPAPCTRICVALPSLIAEMSASVVKILSVRRPLCLASHPGFVKRMIVKQRAVGVLDLLDVY